MCKLIRRLCGTVILVVISVNSSSAQFYYYSGGQQNILNIDSLKVCLKFESTIGQDDQAAIIDSINRIQSILDDVSAVDGFIVCSLSTTANYDGFLDSVQTVDGVFLVEPYYTTTFDSTLLVGERFCAAFHLSISQTTIDSINASLGVSIDYELEGMPNVFIFRNTPSSGFRLLEIANIYYELSETRYAHPIFKVSIEAHSYKVFDYYNTYQTHAKRVIGEFNTASVWDFAGLTQTGIVAVLDDGIDQDVLGHSAHEDLPDSRVLPGRNFVLSAQDPIPGPKDYHGMACAGIIAASHTTDSLFGLDPNSGVFSLAPNTNILPVKIFDEQAATVYVDSLVNAINYAWMEGADVLSNSWGYTFNTCTSYPFDLVDDAILNAYTFGRGGNGCPVIFSSGNFANFHTPVRYPACVTGAFAVGAIQLNDVRWDYSNYGDSLDLVAPSGDVNRQGDVWTLDQVAKNGANWPGGVFTCEPGDPLDGDYYCSFGGTSAAAPVVAGVAALILSRDSNLTADEVYDILRYSAVTDLDWGTITPPDNQYGYGRVDAFRAILSISRGDANNDGTIGNILDLNILINMIFRFGPAPFPSELLGDCDCDGNVDIIDLNYLVNKIFRDGPPPVNPCFEY